MASPEAPEEERVQVNARIPTSLRRRARVYAAAREMDFQKVLSAVLSAYMRDRDA